jgi:hypothetical protein
MYPSLAALGNRSANNGLGGYNVSPVNVNLPGGMNAQRGYQNTPQAQPPTAGAPLDFNLLLNLIRSYART